MREEDEMDEKTEEPNEETRAAMAEFDEMKANPERHKRYGSVDEMLDDILKEDCPRCANFRIGLVFDCQKEFRFAILQRTKRKEFSI